MASPDGIKNALIECVIPHLHASSNKESQTMSNYSPALEKIAAKNIQKWVLAEHARERMQVEAR